MEIEIGGKGSLFKLNTKKTSYVMSVGEDGCLNHLYYGARLSGLEECSVLFAPFTASFAPYPEGTTPLNARQTALEEFTGNGVGDYRVSSVSVRNADGTCCVDPRFVSARIREGKPELSGLPQARVNEDPRVRTLEVTLADPYSGVKFLLNYTVFPEQDVIVRSVLVRNEGTKTVKLERLMSLCLDLPRQDLDLVQLPGTYFQERVIHRAPLHPGIQGFASKRCSTGHDWNPCFALTSHDATETAGDVYGGLLVYSGSHSLEVETGRFRQTRAVMGINPEQFEWELKKGASFQTPEAFLTFSAEGLGGMSRNFHDMIRDHLVSPRWSHAERAILVNNWEATYFNFNREKLLSIARDAADLGIEMLVLDDGWFGKRDVDTCSLGDWVVNRKKIGSLKTLVQQINAMGLKFGLWFEPEMVSPDSDLYRAHPEWALTVPGRPHSLGRHQMILNMADPDVVDYLFRNVSAVLKSANIEYIKWDMNRQPAEMSWSGLPASRQKELAHRYVLGVYELHRRLLDAFPDLFIEGCSGGGGRFDAGMLYYAPQIWTSDNTDAVERLKIQQGTSLFYPASAQGAHVSVCPNHGTERVTSFQTRGHVALAGTFGYELDLNALSEEDRENVRQQVGMYHRFRPLIADGDFYRLSYDPEYYVEWEFAAKDASEAILLCIQVRTPLRCSERFARFRGLDPDALYRIDDGTDRILHGDLLMNAGLPVPRMRGDGKSVLIHIIRENADVSRKQKGKK